MKLVDILARDLEKWPDGVEKIDQSNVDGELYFDDVETNLLLEIADGLGIAQFGGDYVTRAAWQVAFDGLNPEQIATESRESTIKQFMQIGDIYYCDVEKLYDAGARIIVELKP